MKILLITLVFALSGCASKSKINKDKRPTQLNPYSECELIFGLSDKTCLRNKQLEEAGKKIPYSY